MSGAGAKRRPMLVVSDDAFNENERYSKVMVVHLTSVRRLGGKFRWEVTLPKGAAGLERASIVKCSEVCTVFPGGGAGWRQRVRRDDSDRVKGPRRVARPAGFRRGEPRPARSQRRPKTSGTQKKTAPTPKA